MPRLQKIKKTTLSDQVCKIIKDRIKTGQWPQDSRIPSENELADSFGVNRLTVRNALQKLNAMGIVETRAGEGTFVRKFDFTEYIREVSDLVMSPEMLEGVMEFRKCIELECIRLAILRANDNDIEELEKALHAYANSNFGNWVSDDQRIDNIINTDLNFHYQICLMSKNKLFAVAFDTVREPMYQYIKLVLLHRNSSYSASRKASQAVVDGAADHKLLLDSIKNRDYEASVQVYINMIDFKNI